MQEQLPIRPVVYVDHRERLGGLIAKLQEILSVDVRPQWLPYGDMVVNDIFIERKTTQDYVRSLSDGRLFRQVSALLAFSKRRLLILEGVSFPYDSGASEQAVEGSLLKIEVGMQVPIVRTQSLTETAVVISRIVHQEVSTAARLQRQRKKSSAPQNGKCPQEKVLRSMRVTQAECTSLLNTFQTLRQIFAAPLDDLQSIKGIPHDVAERVHKFATEPFQEGSNQLDVPYLTAQTV